MSLFFTGAQPFQFSFFSELPLAKFKSAKTQNEENMKKFIYQLNLNNE